MENSSKAKFQKGEMVYFIGDPSKRALDKDKPYEVLECVPDSNSHYALTIKISNTLSLNDKPDNFISEEEYKQMKQRNKKHNFKGGEIVYYNGPEGQKFKKDIPYLLFDSPGGYFLVHVGNEAETISKEVANAFFISEQEYKQEKGVSTTSSNNDGFKGLANFKKYSKYNTGNVVYYIGTETGVLKNDEPYKVQFYDSNKGIVRINGVVLDTTDVITKNEYDNFNVPDEGETVEIIGKPKDEMEIKRQVWVDTKSGKLKWFRPFASFNSWYRAILKLENPTGAFLKIDLYISKTDNNKWNLMIYYNRKATVDSILIKQFTESSIIKALVNYVKKNLTDDDE